MNSRRHTGNSRGAPRNQFGGYRPPAAARYAAPNGPVPPDHEDNIPLTMEEQRSLNRPADSEIEMDISIKPPPRMPDVSLVETFRIALANVRIGLTNRRH